MMTTRAHLADGTTFDYDEETEAHPTHVNDQPVVRRQFTGPTPPEGVTRSAPVEEAPTVEAAGE